ncbi:UDP-D-galactose:(glucosyl)LPS alpha-1,6-D-galactosyltransferase [Terribacillus aidingensis]|uniref:UDP-D-galactose:(Glucosyl)LPS alpha-1,6-D-galactosyltransferase n=1 Tax=Terribacillus aidingensis TaxID=586416 RepID=A0A285N6V7_9BACI|nr:glycosyltransferase [Terribacillus aidingensis]SNZ05159.1 UDP-D-galactose:(glucosyl)LPS alpha-1,6-D-galactosyltransferase [Terribacillus aidingensis]
MLIDIVLGYAEGKGGLEDVLTTVSKGLVNKGHKVRVLQSHPPKYREWEETITEIYYYGQEAKVEEETVHSMQMGYANFLKDSDLPDVIIATHAPILSYICRTAIARFKPNTPVLSWLHGPPAYFGGERYLNYSDAHLAISSSIGRTITDYIEEQPVYLISNPVDVNQHVIARSEELKIIFIGRLSNKEKRLDVLLRALKGVKGDWSLTVIGDGPDKHMLHDLAESLQISDKISWLGWRTEPWNEIDDASVLVLPSDFEGFGLVLIEALCRGVAVISSDTDGARDIVENGVNGWIFPKGDVNNLKDLLNAIQLNEITLPDQRKCINSVVMYKSDKVVEKINDILIHFTHEVNNNIVKGLQEDVVTCNFISTDIYSTLIKALSDNNGFHWWELKINIINYSYTKAVVLFSYQTDEHANIEEARVRLINNNGTWQVKRIF